ncbi:MAG: branched-chain amino acid ABC transporter permease [Rhizobiaceae bacterium]|nr:branched-chain amino acid ABC transporter permease [Rhizobiaceae bacterium]
MTSSIAMQSKPSSVEMKQSRTPYLAAFILLAIVGATLPLWVTGNPFLLMLASHAVIAAIVALSLDLLTGNTGLLSFGHAAWYGFGAYLAGLLSKNFSAEMVLIIPLTIVAACLVAAVVGAILVRQIGKTFAILTLALSQIFYALVFVLSDQTGGEDGLQGIPMATLFGNTVASSQAWYWLLYGVLIISLGGALYLRTTPLGRAWLAIRENTERASFIGVNTGALKLIAYVFSAGLASLAGALFVLFNGAVSPDVLHWFESGKILMYVVLGGVGTIVGPVFGAALFTFLEHYVSSYTDAWLIYFGGLFVLIVIVAPGGLFGIGRSIYARFKTGKGQTT